MDPLQPLISLLEQNRAERDQALAEHQRLLRAVQAAQDQAEQLTCYRSEYAQRYGSAFQRSGTLELMQCYQGFMTRLDGAVDQQKRSVAQTEARASSAQTALLAAELRVASVEKLIERRRAEMAGAAQRRDQKASDELAARMAWQRANAPLSANW